MKFTLRIKKSKTFKYILKKGKYVKGEFLTIHICKTKYENSINFFGVCVSKKNGNSVQRNKLKRWVREVYKSEEQKLKKGYNIVFLYKKTTTISNTNYNLLKNDIEKCFESVDLYEK